MLKSRFFAEIPIFYTKSSYFAKLDEEGPGRFLLLGKNADQFPVVQAYFDLLKFAFYENIKIVRALGPDLVCFKLIHRIFRLERFKFHHDLISSFNLIRKFHTTETDNCSGAENNQFA